jgi:hypothetical protein
MKVSVPNHSVKHPYGTADRAVWIAFQFLKRKNPGTGVFPLDLAKDSGMTQLESRLALRLLEKDGIALYRKLDGRFFLTEKGMNA